MDKVVYIHKNPNTLTPFYVGMGDVGRPYQHGKRNSRWGEYVKKNGNPIVDVVAVGLSKEDSLELEEFITREIGIEADGSGPLVNLDYGNRRSKFVKDKIKGFKHSEEFKKHMSEIFKGEKSYMFGVPKTEEQKRKMSKAAFNRKGPTPAKGRFYINNGISNRMIYPSDEIPDGWKKGRFTPWMNKK